MKPTARLLLIAAGVLGACVVARAQDTAARRMALLVDGVSVETLAAAVDDPDLVVARTAARVLAGKGEAALPALGHALRHEDILVRRSAVMHLGQLGTAGLELIGRALRDGEELVRQGAVFALAQLPHTVEVADLLAAAQTDQSALVQRAALLAARAAFETAESIPLPREGWRFRTDAEEVGLQERWFAVEYDDADWEPVAIERFWGEQGPDPGVGWYRLSLDLPAREKPTKAQLSFGAVDESAWVWVNGDLAGEHDEGPSGWETPFRIDVTDMLRWGERNQITVRVLNTAMAGGIYKPVSILLLEPAR
ncbi:MAG: HEAT repeat domain-containing protein [Armatimonadota bacterium]